MVEAILAIVGLIGGFLIALGWYRRGLIELEKEVASLKERLKELEKDSQGTRIDIEVIKERIGSMESKINDMHAIITIPAWKGDNH